MKRVSETVACLISISFLTACGGVDTDSKTSSQSTTSSANTPTENISQPANSDSVASDQNTANANTDAVSTQNETVDNPQGQTTEESVAMGQDSANEQPPAQPNEQLERAITAAKAAMSMAKQSLVSNEISTTNSLASFKTDSASTMEDDSKLNVTKMLSSIMPVSTTVTENLTTTTVNGQCGGSAVSDGSRSYDDEVGFPYVIQAAVVFDEYCNDIDTVYTGNEEVDLSGYTIVFNGEGSLTSEFPNEQEGHYEFDLSFAIATDVEDFPPVVEIRQWVSCSYFSGAANFNPSLDCTTTLVYEEEEDGFTSGSYQVVGDNQTGYDVSLTYSDAEDNLYDASFSELTVCDNGNFGSGEGELFYDDETISIVYQNCSQAVANYQGTEIQLQF